MNLDGITFGEDGTLDGLNNVLEMEKKLEKLPDLFFEVKIPKLKVYYRDSKIVLESLKKGYIFSPEMGFKIGTNQPNEYLFDYEKQRYIVILKN